MDNFSDIKESYSMRRLLGYIADKVCQIKNIFACKVIEKYGKKIFHINSGQYNRWFLKTTPDYTMLAKQEKSKFDYIPLISIIVPTYNTSRVFLCEMINAVLNQTYANWELCIADGNSTNPDTRDTLEKYLKTDIRIKVKFLDKNYMISGNSNEALALATGDYVAFLDHDDLLAPNTLFEFVSAINEHDKPCALYCDEDIVNEKGNVHLRPHLKPDWSPHLLLSYNYVTHFLMVKKSVLAQVGCFRGEFDGAQDYDLILRIAKVAQDVIHIPKILYHWRESPSSTSSNGDSKPYAHEAGQNAITDFIKNRYPDDTIVIDGSNLFTYRLSRKLNPNTLVSIIIPTKDGLDFLKPCVESILAVSSFQNYEIIILNNNSTENETYAWFNYITSQHKNIRILEAFYEFNWSKLNNHGIANAKGDVFIFLNNDTKIINNNWIDELSCYALDTDVGVVGGLLLYDDGTIQHAGVVVGMCGWAEHIFKFELPVHNPSPFVSNVVLRDVLAVTGACMAISRATIGKIGVFDENFIICGSDVEICIRAYKNGLYNIYNPMAKLYHYESKTRSACVPDVDFIMSEKYYSPYRENGDPFFNPNLDYNSLKPLLRVL